MTEKSKSTGKQSDTSSIEKTESVSIGTEKKHVFTKDGEYFFAFESNRNIGQNLLIPEKVIGLIITLYANETKPAWTAKQIAETLQCPVQVIQAILRELAITHNDFVNSDFIERLEAEGYSEDEVTNIVSSEYLKHIRIKSGVQKKLMQQTADDAKRWQMFKAGVFDPFKEILETQDSKEYRPRTKFQKHIPKQINTSDDTLCVILSDVHFGDAVEADKLFKGESCDINVVVKRLEEYLLWIREQVRRGVCSTDECVLFSLGDLLHSVRGVTEKGTYLPETNPLGSQQWHIALEAIVAFIEGLAATFNKVSIHAVSGNHDPEHDRTLLIAATRELIRGGVINSDDVHLPLSRLASTVVRDTYILFEHGASPKFRHKVPRSDSGRAAYIDDHILSDPLAQCGNKNRVFLCGDTHNREHTEYKSFDFIKSGSMFNPNIYATELGFGSRPSQTAFCLNNNGVSTILKKQFVPLNIEKRT